MAAQCRFLAARQGKNKGKITQKMAGNFSGVMRDANRA
jgi:hypothetical protein